MNLRTMRLAFIAAAGMAAVPAVAASEGGCFVTCKRETGSCQLADRAIAQGLPQLVESCRSQKVTAGPVIAQFRSDGKAGRAQIQGSFSDALAAYKVIDCLAGDSCTSSGGAAKVVLGKGFDPAAAWQVVGDPCGIGLPCGKVGLPADALQVRMKGASAQGRLRVFPARGQGGEQTVDVVAGGAVLPVGLLKSGQTYRYQWIGSDGSVQAAGEFAVLSQRTQQDSDGQLADAMKKPAGERAQAVIESLLLDGRDWEALQWSLGARQ